MIGAVVSHCLFEAEDHSPHRDHGYLTRPLAACRFVVSKGILAHSIRPIQPTLRPAQLGKAKSMAL